MWSVFEIKRNARRATWRMEDAAISPLPATPNQGTMELALTGWVGVGNEKTWALWEHSGQSSV